MLPAMKDDFVTKNKGILYLILFVIALITFFPLFNTGLGTADDFHYYMATREKEIMNDASFFAVTSGRFYYYFIKPVYNIPYLVDNMAVTKIFQFLPLVLCFLFFARIVSKVTKSEEFAFFFLLLFLVTLQASKDTSLFIAYPFFFSFSFILLLASFYLLMLFYESRKRKHFAGSVVLFGLGLLFYETYILYLLFAFLAIVYYNFREETDVKGKIRKILLQMLPFVLVGAVYLAAYFIFRIYHPSQYAGTTFTTKHVTLRSFLKVLWGLSFTSFPLTVYQTSREMFHIKSELVAGYSPVVLSLLLATKVEWLVKGILVSFLGFRLLGILPRLQMKRWLAIAGTAVLLIFVPHIPMAYSEKYYFYVVEAGMKGYVTTFFSFFGTLLLITLLLAALASLFSFHKIVKTAIISIAVFGIFICSMLTDYSNYMVARDIHSANLRFYALDDLMKTDEFKSIPPGSPFFGPTLYDSPSICAASLTGQDFSWDRYMKMRTGNKYPFWYYGPAFLDFAKKTPQVPWLISARQADKSDDLMLVLSKMKPIQPTDTVVDHYSDRATVLYYSPYKIFTVSFHVRGDTAVRKIPVQVNHIHDTLRANTQVEFNIYCIHKEHSSTVFTITAPGIDLNSILISNMINPKGYCYYLEY